MKKITGGEAVAVLAAVNAAVMLLRFTEQCVLASGLGAGQHFDAYFIGQIVILLGGQLTVAITSAGVPLIVEASKTSRAATKRLLSRAAVFVCVICIVIATLSGPIVDLLGGKLDASSRHLARSIFLWLVPSTGIWILAAVARAHWYAERRFLVPGLGHLFIPICTCTGAALVACKYWSLTYVAASANLGSLLLLAMLCKPLIFDASGEVSDRMAAEQLRKVVRQFCASLLPVSVGLALMPAMIVVARVYAASLGSGRVTAISLAASIASIPAQFAAASVGAVLLAHTSRLKTIGEKRNAAEIIERALCNTAFVVIPCAIVLLVWPRSIVQIIFEHGAFDSGAVGLTAAALTAYSVGIPLQAAVQVLTFAMFAMAGSRSVAVASLFTIGLDVLLSRFASTWGLLGVAGAFSVACFLQCCALLWLLAKNLPELRIRSLLFRHLRIIAFSCVALAVTKICENSIEAGSPTLTLGLVIVIGGTTYLSVNSVFRGIELQYVLDTLRYRIGKHQWFKILSAAE